MSQKHIAKKFPCNETFAIFASLLVRTMDDTRLNVILLDEASEFLRSLPEKPRKKILYNILRVERGEIDKELFEKLNDHIWEFRTLFNNVKYRLLSFWDTENKALIVATHGFTKKTQKTPLKEIAKAEAIRKEYFTK